MALHCGPSNTNGFPQMTRVRRRRSLPKTESSPVNGTLPANAPRSHHQHPAEKHEYASRFSLKGEAAVSLIAFFHQLLVLTGVLPRDGNSTLSSACGTEAAAFAFESLTKAGRTKGRHSVFSLWTARHPANSHIRAEQSIGNDQHEGITSNWYARFAPTLPLRRHHLLQYIRNVEMH